MNAFTPSSRLAAVGPSAISSAMAAVARRRRSGRRVIGVHVGEPDFDTPEHIKDAALRAIRDNDTHYTATDGSPELKAAIQHKFARDNDLHYEPEEITAATGAKMLIFMAFFATLQPGDEVVVAAPYWTSYLDIIAMMGARATVVATRPEDGYRLRPNALEAAISPRTRWLMLNSPANPSGAVYQARHYEPLLDVLARHPRVWILADDIYEHLVYDDVTFTTPAQIRPDLRDRTLTINGVSKAYAMTGWRIGYGAGPKPLMRAMATILSQSTSCTCSIAQAAAAAALAGPQDSVERFRREYAQRRQVVIAGLNAIPSLRCVAPDGAFYAFVDWKHLRGATAPDGTVLDTDEQLCRHLLDDHGVAVIPGSAFGAPGHFRLSFAAAIPVLAEALDQLRVACTALVT